MTSPLVKGFCVSLAFWIGLWGNLLWSQTTQIIIHYEVDAGSFLAIRGNTFPLNWQQGQSCVLQNHSQWIWTSTKIQQRTEFKILWNDHVWSVGANYQVDPGERCEIYPFFGKTRGTRINHANFISKEFQNSRTLRIYLPPSYFENLQKKYPVLYVQDGQNLFDPETSAFGVEWALDETLDRLISNGEMEEVIVVGIDHTGTNRLFEYTTKMDLFPESGGSAKYKDFLKKTLMPYIEERYRVLKAPKNTGIMGSSLGGLVSFELAWTEPSIFGKIGVLSGSFWWNYEEWASRVANAEKKKIQIYLDCGTINDGLAETERFAEILRTKGYLMLFYREEGGRHQESFWAKRVERPLKFLFPFQSTDYTSPTIFTESPENE